MESTWARPRTDAIIRNFPDDGNFDLRINPRSSVNRYIISAPTMYRFEVTSLRATQTYFQWPNYLQVLVTSHIPSPSHHNRLAVDIAKQWTRHSQNDTGCFCRRTRSSQRNISMGITSCGFFLGSWYPQRNFSAIGSCHEGTVFFRCGQSSQNVPERHTVRLCQRKRRDN